MARKMKKQTAMKKQRKPKQYVPGWGGMAGRAIGTFSKWATTKGSTANKALRLARKVANLVNIEFKYKDTSLSQTAFDWSGSIATLNNPAQGQTDTTRIGDSIKVQSLKIRGTVNNASGANITSNCRLIVFWDEQEQISTAADLLENTASTVTPFSPKHYDKRFRSIVLFDQMVTMSSVSGSNSAFRNFEIELPIGKHTQFSAASTTINTGALKFLYISDLVTSNLPTITYYARVFYTDD